MSNSSLTLTLETVTPLFLAGADNQTPELRAASFRGVLRFWFRALAGARTERVAELQQLESAAFGSTDLGSPVVIRASGRADPPLQTGDRRPLLHSRRRRFTNRAFVEGGRFQLELSPRPGLPELSPGAIAATLLLLTLGGLGKRSRRGFGSLRGVEVAVEGIDLSKIPEELFAPQLADGAGLAGHVGNVLNWTRAAIEVAGNEVTSSRIPGYPQFLSDHAKVLVCQHAFSSYKDAMNTFWKVLRSDRYRDHERAFGYAFGGRRASPLILHMSRSDSGYHLVMTAFRSQPSPEGDEGWRHVAAFLDTCANRWQGTYKFGKGGTW